MKFSWACGLIRLKSKSCGYLFSVWLLILFFTVACSSHPGGSHREGILKSDVLVELLIDIHYADGIYNKSFDVMNYVQNPEHDTLDFYKEIFNKYDIDKEDFRKTLQYYSYDPYEFEAIYDRVVDELNKRMMLEEEALYSNPEPDNTGKL